MQIQLSPDEAAQIHPETGDVIEPGDTADITDDGFAKGLLEQTDKWLPVKAASKKKDAD